MRRLSGLFLLLLALALAACGPQTKGGKPSWDGAETETTPAAVPATPAAVAAAEAGENLPAPTDNTATMDYGGGAAAENLPGQ